MKNELYDRVYACWMGKNIGGTLGGPLEGRMELMDIKGYTKTFTSAVENDDLDLQLVNLHCIEQNGGRADSRLLSREWLEHVHFEYDEYGHALTNMRRGLSAPLSGSFNNFFTDCMGSPIRSEIWAVLCAGNPDLAAYYAYQDASVDHAGGEGVYGEIFFAVLEAMAFFEKDKFVLIDKALSYLPENSAVRGAVELLLTRFRAGDDWVTARQAILDAYGQDNFTYAPVNIAFTLVGWLYKEGFTEQMLTTVNCGYDTDCTVATLGSLLGILYGSAYIDEMWTKPLGENIVTSKPIWGFDAPKTIGELTDRTLRARELIQTLYGHTADKSVYEIPYLSDAEEYRLPLSSVENHDLIVRVKRCPVFAPGEMKEMTVTLVNPKAMSQSVELIPHADGFDCEGASVTLEAGESRDVTLTMTAPCENIMLTRSTLEVSRINEGVYWMSENLPLTVWGSMDWLYEADGESDIMRLTTNRIGREMLPETKNTLAFETTLTLFDEGRATLKLACENPVKVILDGETIIDCPDKTIVIPAYHRADKRKCAALPEGPGEHTLRIEVVNPEDFKELYFMVVTPDLHWAYRLDSTFTVEE